MLSPGSSFKFYFSIDQSKKTLPNLRGLQSPKQTQPFTSWKNEINLIGFNKYLFYFATVKQMQMCEGPDHSIFTDMSINLEQEITVDP